MIDLPLPVGVIALPAIAPLIALIQLLFPGLLGEHWKQYRAAIGVLLSQSTLMFAQWIATFWMAADSSWWLSPQALAWGMAAVAVIGFVASLVVPRATSDAAPAKIEFLALQGLALASAAWLAWQWFIGASILDQMLVIALGCVAGVVHLLFRRSWSAAGRRATFATESVFLLAVAASGTAVAHYAFANVWKGKLAETGDSSTFRVDERRSGTRDGFSRGPDQPVVLQTVDLPLTTGQLLAESSPVVVDGALFIGARLQIQASAGGALFGIPLTAEGRFADQQLWKFGDQTTRAVFSSPAVHDNLVYFGEGYHQHQKCRLFCLDAKNGELVWSFRTTSHVESPPTIVGERIYFGAGDDGVYALNLPQQKGEKPSVAWHYGTIHADASPLVAEGKVFVGGVLGDVISNLKVVALDETKGNKLWERPAEMSFPAAPAYADGGVFLALGNGKLSGEAERPQGAVWRLSAADGEKLWEFPLDSSVLSSPIPVDESVYFVARNGDCYSLSATTGDRKWKHSIGEEVVSSPIVSGGRIFVVTIGGSVVCLDGGSGEEIWRLEDLRKHAADGVYSSPMLAFNKLYVAMGNKVFCLGDRS